PLPGAYIRLVEKPAAPSARASERVCSRRSIPAGSSALWSYPNRATRRLPWPTRDATVASRACLATAARYAAAERQPQPSPPRKIPLAYCREAEGSAEEGYAENPQLPTTSAVTPCATFSGRFSSTCISE